MNRDVHTFTEQHGLDCEQPEDGNIGGFVVASLAPLTVPMTYRDVGSPVFLGLTDLFGKGAASMS